MCAAAHSPDTAEGCVLCAAAHSHSCVLVLVLGSSAQPQLCAGLVLVSSAQPQLCAGLVWAPVHSFVSTLYTTRAAPLPMRGTDKIIKRPREYYVRLRVHYHLKRIRCIKGVFASSAPLHQLRCGR